MKKLFLTFGLIVAATIASAATQYPLSGNSDSYEFILGSRGGENGYIQINQNITSFTFSTDFGSVGNAGTLGFYTYTDDPTVATDGGVAFRKSNGSEIDLGSLTEGEKVGFYLTRNNGDILTDFFFVQEDDNIYLKFTKNTGNGKDEMFLIANVSYANSGKTSGQPLPGILAALLVGGGVAAYRRKRAATTH